MQVTKFRSTKDNIVQRFEVPWEKFAARITAHSIVAQKTDVPLFSCVRYCDEPNEDSGWTFGASDEKRQWTRGSEKCVTNTEGQVLRANVNVREVTALVLDYDSGVQPEPVVAHFAANIFAIYSTFSNTAEHPKFRIVMPFAEPIGVEQYKRLWKQVVAELPEKLQPDQSCKDPARLFYFPSCPPGAEDSLFICRSLPDAVHIPTAIREEALPEMAPAPTPEPPKAPKPPKPPKAPSTKGRMDYTTLDGVAWLSSKGLYLQPAGPDKHYVRCPWQGEHTNAESAPTDTVLWTEAGKWPTFKCSHSHCADRDIKSVMEKYGDADDFCGATFVKESCVALGYDKENFYYQSTRTNQLVALRASAHNKQSFYGIIPNIAYWSGRFWNKDKGKLDWDLAACTLMKECQDRGYFQPEAVRGLGVWLDEGRTVVHLGHSLLVDGKTMGLTEIRSDYVYEAAVRPIELLPALGVDDTRTIVKLAARFPVVGETEKKLLAGMAVTGILSSALEWRPHMWITGDQGSGKSQILSRFLGKLWSYCGGLNFEGATTSAGIRQTVRFNGVPVTVDEPEAVSAIEVQRVRGIIDLARSSSTNSIGVVAKGTTEGRGMSFNVKNCFVLCSISHSLDKAQDIERFTIIPVKKSEESRCAWPDFKQDLTIVDRDFSLRFFRSVVESAQVILANAHTIHKAIITNMPEMSSRWGDQTAALLAGYLHLVDRSRISEARAIALLGEMDFVGQKEMAPATTSYSALEWLKSYQVRDLGAPKTMGELICEAADNEGADAPAANKVLKRYGMKVMRDRTTLAIACVHPVLKKVFEEGGFSGYSGLLMLVNGSRRTTVRIVDNVPKMSMTIPLEQFGYGANRMEAEE